MQDGATIRNGYPLDLDSLTVGSRVGMMRCTDGTLHYYLDGVDQGVASTDIAAGESLLEGTSGFNLNSVFWGVENIVSSSAIVA